MVARAYAWKATILARLFFFVFRTPSLEVTKMEPNQDSPNLWSELDFKIYIQHLGVPPLIRGAQKLPILGLFLQRNR